MKFNRLAHFQNNPGKLSRFRLAISILYELGVDQLLADLAAPVGVSDDHPNILQLNALQNERFKGALECINNLFSLDKALVPETQRIPEDYGAIDIMIKEGRIKQEDVDTLLNGID